MSGHDMGVLKDNVQYGAHETASGGFHNREKAREPVAALLLFFFFALLFFHIAQFGSSGVAPTGAADTSSPF